MTEQPPTPTRDSTVSLRQVTAESVRTICRLDVHESQRGFVAPNAVSIAQAYFEPKAVFRAIYAGETPVGFMMLYDDPDEANYHLWRFMIDARYQKLGFGARALQLILEYVHARPGAKELSLTCHPGEDGPEPFYRKQGFALTGKMFGEEAEMTRQL